METVSDKIDFLLCYLTILYQLQRLCSIRWDEMIICDGLKRNSEKVTDMR